jgi:hypothetical protein
MVLGRLRRAGCFSSNTLAAEFGTSSRVILGIDPKAKGGDSRRKLV